MARNLHTQYYPVKTCIALAAMLLVSGGAWAESSVTQTATDITFQDYSDPTLSATIPSDIYSKNEVNGLVANAAGPAGPQGDKGAGIVVNTADGTATIAEDTNSDNKVTVYSQDKTDALLNANADAIAKRKVTTDADGNIATITDGTTSVEVYNKKLANQLLEVSIETANEVIGDRTGKTTSVTGDITALQTTVGRAAQGDNPATGLVKNVATNKADIETETKMRANADNELSDLIDEEAETRFENDGVLRNAITTEATSRTKADDALGKRVTVNETDIHAINDHLGVRKTTRADGRTRPTVKDGEALEAVVSLHATGANDPAGDQAEITISNSEVAIPRGDGEVVFDADNDAAGGSYTRIRGGTATTIQTLRDQDIGVAPGTGNSGVLFQTTMYGLGGDYSVEYTANQAAFNAFTADGTLPDDAPIGATGIVDEGGTYKYVTNVRLGGVAAGVADNDAVNKGQLDAANVARTNADAALGRRIDTNSQRIDGNTQGVANVAAMASLPALPNGASSGFSAGIGGYNGKSALAIGFQHRLGANTTFKVSAATGNKGKPTVGAGFSYSWGGSRYSASSQTVAMRDVTDMQNQLRMQKTDAMQAKEEAAQAKAALASVMERLEALEAKGAM